MLRSLPGKAAVGGEFATVLEKVSEVNIVSRAVQQDHMQHSLEFVSSLSSPGCCNS